MDNFLQETIEKLSDSGKTVGDVLFVQDYTNSCSWNEFVKKANFEYDGGYGSNVINLGLKVVGDNWWLERHEYDGSEWWEYKEIPNKLEEGDVDVKDSMWLEYNDELETNPTW